MNNTITSLSREDLQKEVKAIRDSGADLISSKMGLYLEAMESLLAVMDARPAMQVIARFGAGVKATCYEGSPRPEVGDLLYTSPPAPSAPDGWQLVPIEPTEHMVIEGFESEPGETFSEPGEWEKYSKMSGCQQAAYKARLCWDAMLAASPAPGDS